ncbi:MAG: helicase C-terminal domain-containing protein, partial [Spirochaetota bacterium]
AYLDELHGSAAELASISQWAAVTQDGSLSDLSFRPRSGVWEQVCGESDNCLGLRCEYHENCFIIQARRRAAAAHVLITNHHLLFADLELRDSGDLGYEKTAVLPPYRHIVLDEAHNLERNAQSFFSENLSRFSAQRSLRRLYYKRRNRQGGLWAALRPYAELEAEGDLPDILAHSQALEEALAALDEGAGVVLRQGGRNPEKNRGGGAINLRIPEDWQRLPASVCEALQKDLWPALERVRTALGNLLQALRQVHDLLEDVLEDEEQKLLLEWRQLSRRLEALRDTVLYWLDWQVADVPDVTTDPPTPERVFWLERRSIRGKEYYHRLISTQLNIGERLQKVLYKPMRTVVMVSATLTVRGSFDYWFSRVGLRNAEEPEEGQSGVRQSADSPNITGMTFRSPFDYRNRVHLLLANDAPGPSSGARYDAYVARFALKALSSMGGRSLLLFTSYAALNRCYDFLESNGALNLLRQGDDDSPRLLRRFKEEESQSLLATDSFWEGVDAPGPTLGQVILCRLPFRSPDDPIVAAHMESLELRGQNAFFHYSLPEAILRFRQGFGRLMRRTSDQGLVVVLDPRIVQKPYGKNFLESLPPTQIVCGDFEHLQRYIQTFAGEIL